MQQDLDLFLSVSYPWLGTCFFFSSRKMWVNLRLQAGVAGALQTGQLQGSVVPNRQKRIPVLSLEKGNSAEVWPSISDPG